jgi:Fe-S cluster assembly ATPase SufC
MAMLEPKLAILDETDSGLDIDTKNCCSRWKQTAQIMQHCYSRIISVFRLVSFQILHVLVNDAL